jgi:hypothetical protein
MAQATGRLQSEKPIGGRLTGAHAQFLQQGLIESTPALDVTGRALADTDDILATRVYTEHGIEGGYTVDLAFGNA